ncbi:MAG: hypothetical protein WKF90_15125 [Pyrinomonadaceae bacterium]
MKNYFLTIFILITLLMLPKAAFASCMVKPSVEDEAKRANLVFVGTVTKITPAQIASAGYQMFSPKIEWKKEFFKTDVATFTVSEAFKGELSETIEIATSADGDAGYKLEGGTWLRIGETYLVYAYKRQPIGTVDDDLTDENYKDVAVELRKIQESFPKDLATEINEFNSKISPFSAGVCGRTTHISSAGEELEQIRKMFPEAKRFSTQADAQQLNGHVAETATFFQRLLSFFGLA